MTTRRTRSEITGEVEDLAIQVRKQAPDLSIEAARALVYEEVPELYEEYVAAPPERPDYPMAKAAPELTLGEEIHAAVKKQAAHLAWTEWPTKSLEDIEWELWTSDEGRMLYDLYTSPESRQPLSQAQVTIGKSFAHADVWQVLKKWRAG